MRYAGLVSGALMLASCQSGSRRSAGSSVPPGEALPSWTVLATVPRAQLAAASKLSGVAWSSFGQGHVRDRERATAGASGPASFKLHADSPGQVHGAQTTVVLGQRAAGPIG